MSEVLYRKYRPQKFGDVLGQDNIVRTLKGGIEQGRVSHAYLFAGPRGTGKTSMARILAHELKVHDNDIYEMDAASNNGVDEIRMLQEGIRTLPFESKVKVYIVDEVHMLSKGAFNALLKTLEEPPSYVVFILATTELHKVPETVISRCQTFQFKKPAHDILRKMVISVAKKEGVEIGEDSADLIALLGDGSFRDTHGILQKVIGVSKNKKISLEEVEDVTGAPKMEIVHGIIENILDKDLNKSLSFVREASRANIDQGVLIKMILHGFRQIILFRFAPDIRRRLEEDLSAPEAKFFVLCTNHKNSASLSLVLRELLTAYEETRTSYIGELPLELALIKLAGAN
ncbi:MAG: DNA polymerase III subunit gamma/tau [Candidatus Vogelbacteria bacterium]|nr:DNA polymerase III subunit gamma/tau [Candidatus Vogelbacteria bacterium]